MKEETFEHILRQLASFDGYIHLYLRNEPLLDKRIARFAQLAKERTKARIVIQTNGSLLTGDLAAELARFATVIVNDYTSDHRILALARGWNKHANIVLAARNEGEILSNRAGNVPGRPTKTIRAFCTRPFDQMCIAFNGNVVLCCQDWKLETFMGNVNDQDISQIWGGTRLSTIRLSLLKKNRSGLCAACDFPGV
jgi:radical SAM protein with 4Fe4S-binding SPASM domain